MFRARRFVSWSRDVILERGLLALFACVLIFHLTRRAGAPKELELLFYNDHFRHFRYAWESMSVGPRIYVMNTADLKQIGDLRAYAWGHITYFYPPGALLLSMPAAQLAYRGIISFDAAGNAMVFLFSMAAAFVGIRVWLHGARQTGTFEGSALWFGIGVVLLLNSLYWSLHGQYDPLVVAICVVAGQNKSPPRRLLLLSVAFFLKFQALVCLPFFARDLYLVMREHRLFKPGVFISLALTAMSLATAFFLGASGRLALAKQSPFHFVDFPKDRLTVYCTLFTALFVVVAAMRGRFAAAACATWVFMAFASLAVVQAWYCVFFFAPVFLIERRSQPWFGSWVVGLIYLIQWFPDVYRVASNLLVLAP